MLTERKFEHFLGLLLVFSTCYYFGIFPDFELFPLGLDWPDQTGLRWDRLEPDWTGRLLCISESS